ncbi:MAG: phage Gp37/Gp68 family protein [Rhodospirillaceae bacterium]
MGENTAIEWATHTFNPWVGCTRLSPACDNCYAADWAKRTGQAGLWAGERRRTTPANWQQPVRWNRRAAAAGRRDLVFCASLADVFDNQVPERWRNDLWHRIAQTPHLDWLLLTKRPENIARMLPDTAAGHPAWGAGWPNVWLGTTVEDQKRADHRVPILRDIPARVRFLSCEPLLGAVDLTDFLMPVSGGVPKEYAMAGGSGTFVRNIRPPLDWVIAGGESGPGARPMHPAWARGLRDQCADAGVPFFFKQWGEWTPGENVERMTGTVEVARWFGEACRFWRENLARDDGHIDDQPDVYRVGKAAAGARLDGVEWRQFPNHGGKDAV